MTKYSDLSINDRQKEMILTVSDDLNIDEIEAFELAVDLSVDGVKSTLERKLDIQEDISFASAMKELYFYRKIRLIMILDDLMKSRATDLGSNTTSAPLNNKKDVIMKITNELFCDNLATNVMNMITDLVKQLLEQTSPKFKSKFVNDKVCEYMMRLAELLFYMLYSTQITRSEADQLLELIRFLSNALIPTLSEKVATSQSLIPSTSNTDDTSSVATLDSSLYPILIILQLSHVRSLNQVIVFYNREFNDAPYGHQQQGNALLDDHDTEWEYGKELVFQDSTSLKWENRMVRGFTCLSLGVIRQPFIEKMLMNTGESTIFFDKAYECNAYSYIRLCLVPVIQSFDDLSIVNSNLRELLMNVLVGDEESGLVVDLMNCYVNDVYRHNHYDIYEFPFNEWGRQRDLERRKYDLDNDVYESSESPDRVIFTDHVDENPPIACDCVDDILDMLTTLISASSKFASKLMHKSGAKHPFINALLDIVDKEYHELKYPKMRFLTALANSQQTNFAYNVYSMINSAKSTYSEFLDWRDYFQFIEDCSIDLQRLLNQSNQQPKQNQYQSMTPPDEYFLEDSINLIGAVMKNSRVSREIFSQQLDPVKKLFNLLVCQIGVSLKGSILRCLASICDSLQGQGVDHETRLEVLEQVWLYVEEYQLLPSSSLSSSNSKNASNFGYGGLHYELEHVENGTLGQYPVTIGFLTLLVSLLSPGQEHEHHGSSVPHNLGFGMRIPGIMMYVDYVLNEILLKLEMRRYLPSNFSGEGQKWKIASLSLRILTVLLQQYNINSLSSEDAVDISSDRDVRKSKGVSSKTPSCSSIFESPSEEISSVIMDFKDVTLSYPVLVTETPLSLSRSQQHNQQQYAIVGSQSKRIYRDELRPKSAGFCIMSTLLDQQRKFLTFLVSILQENSPKRIVRVRQEEIIHVSTLAIQECMENSELNMCRVREDISARFREMQPSSSSQYYQYDNHRQQRHHQHQQHQDQPHVSVFFQYLVQTTDIGYDDMFYDVCHWRLQAALAVLGLIYEASLREVAFLDRMRSAGPLAMMRNVLSSQEGQAKNSAFVLLDVQVVPLSTSLITDIQSFHVVRHQQQGQFDDEISELPLSCVMSYLSFLPEKVTIQCDPPIEMLSIKILKHVCHNQTNKKVLQSLKEMGADALKLIENCNFFIENSSVINDDVGGLNVARHSGGVGEVPVMWTFTKSEVASVRRSLMSGSSDGSNDKREAVLDLLLTTLRPKDECLSHYLLFGLEGISSALSSPSSTSINCLDAILNLITVEGHGGDVNIDDQYLAVSYPYQALQCFELVYRLYESPLTAPSIKHLVSIRNKDYQSTGHFIINYLKFYLEYNRKKLVNGSNLDVFTLEDTARLNCCAWAIKIIALELTLHSHHHDNENIEQILKVLFDHQGEYAEEHGVTTSDTTSNLLFQLCLLVPLSLDFNFAYDSSNLGGHQESSEAIVIQCMKESSKQYVLGRGRPYRYPGRGLYHNEPPGDFKFVDVPHFILLLKTYFKHSHGKGNESGAKLRRAGTHQSETSLDNAVEVKLRNAVDVAVDYNVYISTMAAMANFCHAFRQIVEVTLFKHSLTLLGDYCMVDRRDIHDNVINGARRHQQVLDTASSAIHKLVTYFLSPSLTMLIKNPAMEMVHAEQLSKCVLVMINTLRNITLESKNAQDLYDAGINTPPPLTATSFTDIMTKVILSLLRRGSIGTPRHSASSTYREKLYECLFILLQAGSDLMSKGSIGYSIQQDVEVQCRGLLEQYVVELMDIIGDDIAQGVSSRNDNRDLIPLRSCASAAFSALTGVLNVLGPTNVLKLERPDKVTNQSHQRSLSSTHKKGHDAISVSPGYLHGLHTLLDRGYLSRIFSSVFLTSTSSSTWDQDPSKRSHKRLKANIDDVDINTLESVLSLGAHLACSHDGTNILLELGIFRALNAYPPLPVPHRNVSGTSSTLKHDHLLTKSAAELVNLIEEETKEPFSIDNIDYLLNRKNKNKSSLSTLTSSWVSNDNIDAMFSLFLLIFRSSLSNTSSKDILDECAAFLIRNHDICAHYLRLQSPSLAGLDIAHSIVSLFCFLGSASPARPSLSSTFNVDNEFIALPSWESRMGARGDSLTTELSKILTALGASPLPADMCPLPSSSLDGRSGLHHRYNRTSSWWTIVNPSTDAEIDLQKTMIDTPQCLRSLASSRSLTSSVSQWTCFDFRKFRLALKIVERSASFFRIRCNEWVKLAASMTTADTHDDHDIDMTTYYDKLGLGLLKFDFAVLAFTFQSLGNLYLQLSQNEESYDKHQQKWMKSPFVYGKLEEDADESQVSSTIEEDKAIRHELLHAVESLLCAVFDLSKATAATVKYHDSHFVSGTTDQDIQMESDLQQCVKITNRFPPHSFVYQIGRSLLAN